MRTDNIGVICTLEVWQRDGLKIKIQCNPGPFPEGPPAIMADWQYLGMCKHLVLTMLPQKWLTGILNYHADTPYDREGTPIIYTGLVKCTPKHRRFFTYYLSPFFIRNVKDILPYGKPLVIGGNLVGIDGMITGRQYWMIEIPALTREVLMSVDEIVVIKKKPPQRKWETPLTIKAMRDYKKKFAKNDYEYKVSIGQRPIPKHPRGKKQP